MHVIIGPGPEGWGDGAYSTSKTSIVMKISINNWPLPTWIRFLVANDSDNNMLPCRNTNNQEALIATNIMSVLHLIY